MKKRAIDHLVLAVADLAQAGAFYEKLGFTLTPRAEHPFGTANRLAQLRGNFLELVAVADATRITAARPGEFSFGAFNAGFLRRHEGMSMLVFQSDDAREDQRGFVESGLTTYAPFDFARKTKLPDGSEAEIAFSLAFVTDRRMPDAAFFACQHHAPQYFWKAEYQQHANGATTAVEVLMAARQPERFAEFFERVAGKDAVTAENGSLRVALEGGNILILDQAGLRKRYPAFEEIAVSAEARFVGFAVAVDDEAALEAILGRNGVPFIRAGERIQIAPKDGFGAIIEFTDAAR